MERKIKKFQILKIGDRLFIQKCQIFRSDKTENLKIGKNQKRQRCIQRERGSLHSSSSQYVAF